MPTQKPVQLHLVKLKSPILSPNPLLHIMQAEGKECKQNITSAGKFREASTLLAAVCANREDFICQFKVRGYGAGGGRNMVGRGREGGNFCAARGWGERMQCTLHWGALALEGRIGLTLLAP